MHAGMQLRNARTTSSATSLRSLDFQMQKKKIWKKEMGVFLKDRHKKETVSSRSDDEEKPAKVIRS